MPETTQKLLVAMLRIKKTGSLLEELCARLKTRKEKRTTEVFVSLPKYRIFQQKRIESILLK